MKKKFVLILLLFAFRLHASGDDGVLKYRFVFYEVVKGKMVGNTERPNYGFRLLKKLPLHTKEFTFSAKYIDYRNEDIKKACEEVLSGIKEWRHKNAYHLVNGVYDYIKQNINDREMQGELTTSIASEYYSGAKVFREKRGNELEKCRLATAMLRNFTIPAMIVGYKGGYGVEYFLRPLEGKSRWYLMSFSEPLDRDDKYIEPMEWNPVDKKELIGEEIRKGKAFIKKLSEKRFYLKDDKDLALSKFEHLISEGEEPKEDYGGSQGFYLMREIEYEVWLDGSAAEEDPVEISIVMPFNNRDTFRDRNDKGTMLTGKWYVKAESPELGIKYKRAHTRMNPPQRGMVYHLPVKLWVKTKKTGKTGNK